MTETLARLSRAVWSSMSRSGCSPTPGEHGDGGLNVNADIAGMDGDREWLRGRQTGVELRVDEESPDVTE